MGGLHVARVWGRSARTRPHCWLGTRVPMRPALPGQWRAAQTPLFSAIIKRATLVDLLGIKESELNKQSVSFPLWKTLHLLLWRQWVRQVWLTCAKFIFLPFL